MKIWSKRMFSGILAAVMLLPNFPPVRAMAAEKENVGLCEHHLIHEACSYVEGESLCRFVCEICTQVSEKDVEPTKETVAAEETAEQDELVPVPVESMSENISIQVVPQVDLPNNTELFAAFAERKLYGYEMATFGTAARASLNAIEQKIYDNLKTKIETVALSGGSTVFAVSGISSLKTTWTNTELGVTSIEDATAVQDAFKEQFTLSNITNALLTDCPFDLYWFDKTGGVSMSYQIGFGGYTQAGQTIWNLAEVENLEITFAVSVDYRAGSDTVTSNVSKVTRAKDNAAEVVAANESRTAVEKMKAYKEYICDAVSYDHDAADDKTTPYGDPWQLISVFDGDSSTNVVCEGYAKAFQYLCDLGGLDCISVSGTMTGGTGSGGHMWNVVTLEGKKYLVDVTNCDEGTAGAPDKLFLVGAPYVSGSYSFDCGYQTISFLCADLGLEEENYAESQQPDVPLTKYTVTVNASQNGTVTADLTTAVAGATVTLTVNPETGYALKSLVVKQGIVEVDVENNQFIMPAGDVTVTAEFEKVMTGTCGENLIWEFDEATGTLTISGIGPMYDYTDISSGRFPSWAQYDSQVKKLVIENGITRIGDYAFYCCTNLEKASIPASIEEVGEYAFAGIIGQREYVIDQTVRQWSTVQEETQYFPNWETTQFVNEAPIVASGLYGEHVFWELDENGDMVFFGAGNMYHFGEVPTPWGNLSVKSITIEEGITRIGHCAFEVDEGSTFSKTFASITIPSTVTYIGGLAFSNCKALSTITFTGNAPSFNAENNCFNAVTATAYYPANNPTWTSAVMQDYGGTITWVPYGDPATSGTCGEDLTWSYNAGTLTISGTGAMYDYSKDQTNPAPWNHLTGDITKLVIEEGVTEIGDFAFMNCSVIENASFPSTLTRVGEYAFYRFSRPDGNVYHRPFWSEINQTVRQWSQIQFEADNEGFPGWDTTTFVHHVPIIASGIFGDRVFWELNEDGTMEVFGTGNMYEFGATGSPCGEMPVKTVTIGEGITNIGANIFEGWGTAPLTQTFESITIASTVKRVEEMAFTDCKALKTITFTGDAPTFGSNSFRNVTATAYYPFGNASWTTAVMQDYEGNITWEPYCLDVHDFGEWITEGDESYRICELCGYRENKVITNGGDVSIESSENPELDFDVEHVESSDDRYILVEETIEDALTPESGTENEILKAFDITLKDEDGVHVQPDGTVKVKLPLDWDREGNYKVYRVNDDGTLTDMNAYQQGSHMVFETDHFSIYVIVENVKHSHKYQKEVTPPTCTEKGYTTYTCKCGDHYVGDYVKATGHKYDDNVDGTCNACGVNRESVETRKVVHMFRMYNPYTHEHFYTGSEVERENLVALGWQYEGVGFTFPANTGAPVHRLYDSATGEHLYTMDEEEKDTLMAKGWNYEGVAFNSAYDTEAVQHRLHNPYETVGAYHFTFSEEEKQNLINAGWEYQGIGWYSCFK